MAKYKKGGISFNGGDDAPMKPKKMKADIEYHFEASLESLSLDGLFETNPVEIKNKENLKSKPIETDLSKKRKKKGNELI